MSTPYITDLTTSPILLVYNKLQGSGLIFPSRCRPFLSFYQRLTRYIDIGFLVDRQSACFTQPNGCAARDIKVFNT